MGVVQKHQPQRDGGVFVLPFQAARCAPPASVFRSYGTLLFQIGLRLLLGPFHLEHPPGRGVGQHVQVPDQDALDAGIHLVRRFVLLYHPNLPDKGAVGMVDDFLRDDIIQRLHPGQEGVRLVQAMPLLGQLVQDEEKDGLQVHLGGQVPEGVLERLAGADGLGHLFHVLLAVPVSLLVGPGVLAGPDVGQGIVAPGRVGNIGEIKVHHRIAPLLQVLPVQPAQVPLGVGHDQAFPGLEDERVVDHQAAVGEAYPAGRPR